MGSPLYDKLLARAKAALITFAEFMEAALYDPEHGYYTRGLERIGKGGDYITSPAVSPVFGRTIARLVVKLDEILGHPDPFTILEPGAGNGDTAGQIIGALEKDEPELAQRLRYIALERRDIGNMGNHKNFSAVRSLMGVEPIDGLIFSNEFFDALPVHRVVMRNGSLREIYVGEKDGKLADVEGRLSSERLAAYFKRCKVSLIEGQFADVSLEWERWTEELGGRLGKGVMLTIDYGYPSYELFSAIRYRGTLMAYAGHEPSEEFYENPGERDITAHVDFGALADAGKAAGLEFLAFTDQLRLFLALGIHQVLAGMEAEFGNHEDFMVAVQPAKALFMPGMGETFKALVQTKGLSLDSIRALGELIASKYKLERQDD